MHQKRFDKSIEEHAVAITNLETKKIIPLTYKESESHEKSCYICRKKKKKKMMITKNIVKLEIVEVNVEVLCT